MRDFALLYSLSRSLALKAGGCVREEVGSGLIEMAAALPIFLMLLFGFINFAMYTMDLCSMTYGTRAALRYASIHGSNSNSPVLISDLLAFVHPLDFKYPPNTGTIQISYPHAGDLSCSLNVVGYNSPGNTVSICLFLK